ncbi:MAG: GDP-mannose 4,6-dehydratase [Bacteroidia bacterium]|nr:GDP-mannose 4,6-dehydratase [Bacteroidia bacterium]MDW8416822.1 GDP-mannose 4,6-dehydratase [Bacteroidia bacterium]
MKILITGGAGFIGSHLAEKCAVAGHRVTILDNLSTGSLDNITHLLREYKGTLQFVQGTVEDEGLVRQLIEQHDRVYHLASVVGVKRVMMEPLTTVVEGLRGTDVVLSVAAELVRPTLVASTSEVYGRALEYLDPEGCQRLSEDSPLVLGSPAKHRWVYAITKLAKEALAISYHRQMGSPFVVVRFFNTVGPRQSPAYGMVIPNLVQAALSGRPLPVYGTGTQRRSFLHVKDAVEALYQLLITPPREPWGEIFNLGNPMEISIMELAEKIKALVNSNSPIEVIPYEVSYGKGFEDMQRRTPDISKIQAWLGWSPRHDLDDILNEVIQHAQIAS